MLIFERTTADLGVRSCPRPQRRPPVPTHPTKLRLAADSMGKPDTKLSELYSELVVSQQTLYRHTSPVGQLRPQRSGAFLSKAQSH